MCSRCHYMGDVLHAAEMAIEVIVLTRMSKLTSIGRHAVRL